MTRIGKIPITIPEQVSISFQKNVIAAKGPKGKLSMTVMPFVNIYIEDNKIIVSTKTKIKKARQAWGSMRSLIENMIIGVSRGVVRVIEINGIGYRAIVKNSIIELQLGYSHIIYLNIPKELQVRVVGDRNDRIEIAGVNKQLVGQFASNLRALRPPEPYKGKGIKYLEERILRKEGKKK